MFADYDYVVGVDEVGMGCLAGPVVVCAVAFEKKFFRKIHRKLYGLRDSKLLSMKQREKYAQELLAETGLKFKIGLSHPAMIDKINIYQATRLAMVRAVKRLDLKENAMVLIDGPAKIKGLKFDQQAIVKGDRKVFAIACASILAKVYRDKMMIGYAKRFPGYGFEKHKGYGTKFHLERLIFLGPCSIHRRGVAPVIRLL